jgi:site-specific recombinase XerD
MHVKQHLSILFYLKRRRATKDGMIPIYVRVTIDGLEGEISLGCKVLAEQWDNTNKTLQSRNLATSNINKKITQTKTDLERHFDLIQAKQMIATPRLVLDSYKTPLNGERIRQNKVENLRLSEGLDVIIRGYIECANKYESTHQKGPIVPARIEMLDLEKRKICRKIEEFRKSTRRVFYDINREKTLVLALNEYLLDLLLQCIGGERSFNTLEKLTCRKKVFIEYLLYEYNDEDISLQRLDHTFLKNLYHYLMTKREVIHNTATKYLQIIKGIISRAVAFKWINANPFTLYKCTYHDVHHDWLNMDQFEKLLNYQFKDKKLNVIRDIFVFASFTGFAYKEIYTLTKGDVVHGENGKLWILKNRQKTGAEESVPLLPIPIQLLEKYQNSPACQINRKLLPVPTVQEFNKCLKLIAAELGIEINLRTHKARFFFANEITYNNGVPLKTIGRLLGQKNVSVTETYVQANKRNISENMDMVERKLFDADGNLRKTVIKNDSGAKIINLWIDEK